MQEKNITYPTDSKLQKKIIDKCVKIAKASDIPLRRSYKRTPRQRALTFKTNVYDGHTLQIVPIQTDILTGKAPNTATVDIGAIKENKPWGPTQINIPKPPLKKDNAYQKQKNANILDVGPP